MQPKINWIDNLRGIACLMVVMIHTTTWYITNAHSVSPLNWDIANVLNSASRVSVPCFYDFRLSFFGERCAQPRHFYVSPCALSFTALSPRLHFTFTSINVELSLKMRCKTRVLPPVVFLCDYGDLPVSPLIRKNVSGKMLLMLMVIIGIIANPNTVPQKSAALNGCPSICISAATRSTTFSTVSGRAIGMMETQKSSLTLICTALFIIAVFVISRGTLHELRWRGNFADTGICIAVPWCLFAPSHCSR